MPFTPIRLFAGWCAIYENPQCLAADHDAIRKLHNSPLPHADAHGGNGTWDDDIRSVEEGNITAGVESYMGMQNGLIISIGGLQANRVIGPSNEACGFSGKSK